MTVREATITDAAAIARVHVDTWRTTYQGILPQDHLDRLSYERRTNAWKTMLEAPERYGFTYVAEDSSDQIVGVASGGSERSGDDDFKGELYGIYILAEHQRRGIGRCLALAVVDRLARMGLHSMLVWVLTDNPSRGFYEALGGQLVRTKQVEIGGATLDEVAYGWMDTRSLGRASGSREE